VESDLACVYKGKLEKYTRSFIFMKPDIIFMYDNVKAPQAHIYNWLFHAEDVDNKPSVSMQGKRVTINRPKAVLSMEVLSPEVRGRIRLAENPESFIQLDSRMAQEVEFLAVLVPTAKKNSADSEKKFTSSLLSPAGWIGAKVETESGIVQAFFRTGTSGKATVEGYTTDAERFAVEKGIDGSVKKIYLRGSEFSGEGVSVKGNTPLSGTIDLSSGIELEVDVQKTTEISLKLARTPVSVSVNGIPLKKLNYDRKMGVLTISVPAGHAIANINLKN
jgi:hypothetical protein